MTCHLFSIYIANSTLSRNSLNTCVLPCCSTEPTNVKNLDLVRKNLKYWVFKLILLIIKFIWNWLLIIKTEIRKKMNLSLNCYSLEHCEDIWSNFYNFHTMNKRPLTLSTKSLLNEHIKMFFKDASSFEKLTKLLQRQYKL